MRALSLRRPRPRHLGEVAAHAEVSGSVFGASAAGGWKGGYSMGLHSDARSVCAASESWSLFRNVREVRPHRRSVSMREKTTPPMMPSEVLDEGRTLPTSYRSSCTHWQLWCRDVSYVRMSTGT